jgi:LDH2 family malate/lactate/ureidoglycolate dehydrogenase
LPSQRRHAARRVSEANGISLTADEQAMLRRLKEGASRTLS